MPLTPDMRRSIDQIRDYLFGGGYPDPVSNAEQLSFLFFFYLVEGIDAENALKAKVLKQPYEPLFAGEWTLQEPAQRHRWQDRPSRVIASAGRCGPRVCQARRWCAFVRDEVFAFFAELARTWRTQLHARRASHHRRAHGVDPGGDLVDGLRLDQSDADTKGDLFEHVLRQIKQAGELGQFRTPRHIIRAIVAMHRPQGRRDHLRPGRRHGGLPGRRLQPHAACQFLAQRHSEVEMDGKTQTRGLGDKLSAAQVSALQTATFYGNDVDPKMVRLATMNLTLRGLPNVRILLRNVLTTSLDAERKRELSLPLEGYHVVLANPPFSGRVDKDRIVDDVKVGTTTATELLFLKYMMDSLRNPSPQAGEGTGERAAAAA